MNILQEIESLCEDNHGKINIATIINCEEGGALNPRINHQNSISHNNPMTNQNTQNTTRNGTFKIEIRNEGYFSSSYTRHPEVKHRYLIGKGPLSTEQIMDGFLYQVVSEVTAGNSINVAISPFEGVSLSEHEETDNAYTVTRATQNQFEEFTADTEFDLYFWQNNEPHISRENCTPNTLSGPRNPSRNEMIEQAAVVEEKYTEKRAGKRRKDYKHRSILRPPLDGFETIPLDDGKEEFIETYDMDMAEELLSLIEYIEYEADEWDVTVLLPTNDLSDTEWPKRTPSISFTHTGEIATDYYGREKDPGFTVSAIPPRDQFMIETTNFALRDITADNFDVDECKRVSFGKIRTGVNGQKYDRRMVNTIFINKTSQRQATIQDMVLHYPIDIKQQTLEQTLRVIKGIGDVYQEKVIGGIASVEEFFDAERSDLESIDGIGHGISSKILSEIRIRNKRASVYAKVRDGMEK